MENQTTFTVGDHVRFIEIVDPGDDKNTFEILEDNGDRLIVALDCDRSEWSIRPQQVVSRVDVCKCEATNGW